MKKFVRILVLLSVLMLLPLTAMAAKKVGYAKIVGMEGEATIKRRGGDRQFRAVKGMKLVEGDCLYTKSGCNVSIVLDNNSQLIIGENSIVDLAQMRKISSNESNTTVSLKKGSVFSSIKKKLSDKETYQIKTPNAIAGVRGTKFYVNVEKGDTFVNVVEGTVILENIRAKKSVTAKQGDLAKAEDVTRAFLIKDYEKPGIIKDIKDYFIGEVESMNYRYDKQGSTEMLTGSNKDNDYSFGRLFDPVDNSGADSGRERTVSVYYRNIPNHLIVEVNNKELNYHNHSAQIRYSGILEFTGRISDSFPGEQFHDHSRIYVHVVGGSAFSKQLNLDSTKRSFSVFISSAELDLGEEDEIFFSLD